jgi:hypothetical protein
MSLKIGASVAALVALLALSQQAASQTSTTPGPRDPAPPTRSNADAAKAPVTGQILVQDENTILAKDLIGQTVYDPEKAKIGTISDLILTKEGKNAEGFVIGVGGFLGIGEKAVALKMYRLKIMPEADGSLRLAMDVKKEELANAPTFKSKKELDSEKRAAEPVRGQPGTSGAPGSPRPKTN